MHMQLKLFKLVMGLVCQISLTTGELLTTTDCPSTLKESSTPIVSTAAGTSQNGGQICTRIDQATPLISKSGDLHPLWTTPLALAATVWWETTDLHRFL